MKKRFIVIFLASRLMLGLCGCGGSSGTSLPAPVALEDAEDTPADVAGETALEGVEDIAQEESSTDDLVDMWLSEKLTREEIWRMVAYGEIDYEVYEEFLECIPNSQEFDDIQPEEMPENKDIEIDTDVLSLLTAHVVEYEDQDGYTIRETCQLSPIFTEDDAETMYALWEALGNDVADFPSEESLYDASYLLRDARDTCSCNELEYIIGTYTIENLTDGFSITPDNPRAYAGQLATRHVSTTDQEHDATAADFFNMRSVVTVMQPNGTIYYGEQDAVIFGSADMITNTWGPICFVVALPNGATPNRPDGYRYDKIPILLSSHAYFYQDFDAFELAYF